MPSFLNRLFNIHNREWPRVVLLFLMAFVAVTGITWGKLTVQPLFWELVGVDKLGYSFIVEGVLAISLVAIYTPFADRLAHDRLLIAITLFSATAVGFGRLLLAVGWNVAGAFILYPLFTVIPFILNLHWWTYVTGFYDARSAKRIVPVLASNARLAGAFAGLSVGWLTNILGSSDALITLWALSLVLLGVLVWLSPFILRTPRQTAVAFAGPTQSSTYIENVREGYRYVINSPYLRWLAIATLLVTLLLTFLKFQSSDIINTAFNTDSLLSQRFRSATEFLGTLEGVANLLMLPVQIFVLSRLIGRVGLNRANLIFPAGSVGIALGLTAFSLLTITPNLVIMGALAYLTANVFNTTFRNPIDNLLYNAVPLRMKGRARAFVNGMLVPTASLIAGLLLLLPFVTNTTWFLPVLVAVVVLVYLGTAVRVSQQYSHALVSMLEQEDYSFLLGQEAADLTVTDPATLQGLKEKLNQSNSDEFTLFMITLLSDIGGSNAVPILADVARTSHTHIRAATLDILAATDVRGTAVHDLYIEFLHDADARVRRSALAGLARTDGRRSQPYLETAATMLTDVDVGVRIQAVPELLCFGTLAQQAQALQVVKLMLVSEDEQERAYALRALGLTEDVAFVGEITNQLQDSADVVRLEAALILERLSEQKLGAETTAEVTQKMGQMLQDPVERIRQAALITLARTGDQTIYGLLVDALKDTSPQIQATAVAVLTGLGKKIIPTVHAQLDSPDAQLRKMATVILSRINRREYGPLVTAQIQANLLQVVKNYGYLEALQPLNGYPSITVLMNVFKENNNRLVDEIFFLLTAVQNRDAVQIIRESLASDVVRVRENALEALEAVTSPQTAQLVAPMMNPETRVQDILTLGQATWDMQFPDSREAMENLVTDLTVDPWPRTIATYALGEIGKVMIAPPDKAPDPSKTAPAPSLPADNRRAKRRRRDLLDALIDENKESDGSADDVTERRRARRRRAAKADDLLDMLADENVHAPLEPEPEPVKQPDALKTMYYPPPAIAKKFTITRVLAWINAASAAPEGSVRRAAQRASDMIAGRDTLNQRKEGAVLSTIERIIFLKEVLFFHEMSVDQLKVLATVCEEVFYEEDRPIYKEGDVGGVLYVVVQGKVGIERETRRGTVARLATIEAYSYFGEMNLFDASSHTDTAVALQDTLTLNLRREPLVALARQYPDLSLELINVLSQRLREMTDQVARLSKTHSRALHKVFDQIE